MFLRFAIFGVMVEIFNRYWGTTLSINESNSKNNSAMLDMPLELRGFQFASLDPEMQMQTVICAESLSLTGDRDF